MCLFDTTLDILYSSKPVSIPMRKLISMGNNLTLNFGRDFWKISLRGKHSGRGWDRTVKFEGGVKDLRAWSSHATVDDETCDFAMKHQKCCIAVQVMTARVNLSVLLARTSFFIFVWQCPADIEES